MLILNNKILTINNRLVTLPTSLYCSQYQSVYNNWITKPSDAISNYYNTMVKTIVDAGIWATADMFCLLASHANTNYEALSNWIHPNVIQNLYTSNFSGGEDGWANLQNVTVLGNQDGISDGTTSYDDCLKVTITNTSNPKFNKTFNFVHGHHYRFRMKYYALNAQNITSIFPAGGNVYYGIAYYSGKGLWSNIQGYFTYSSGWTGGNMVSILLPTGSAGNYCYFRNIEIDEVEFVAPSEYFNPVWTQYQGYIGSPSPLKLLMSHYIPNLNAVKVKQDDVTLIEGCATAANLSIEFGVYDGANSLYLRSWGGTSFYAALNTPNTYTIAASIQTAGHFGATRILNVKQNLWQNLTLTPNITRLSSALPNKQLGICGYNNAGNFIGVAKQLRYIWIGAYLDATQYAILINAIETCLDALGTGLIP